jgi:hypothetical protein
LGGKKGCLFHRFYGDFMAFEWNVDGDVIGIVLGSFEQCSKALLVECWLIITRGYTIHYTRD